MFALVAVASAGCRSSGSTDETASGAGAAESAASVSPVDEATATTDEIEEASEGTGDIAPISLAPVRRVGGCVDAEGVVIYGSPDFGGPHASVDVGRLDSSDLASLPVASEALASLCVAPGYVVTLFSEEGFGGRITVLDRDVADLEPFGFAGDVASMVVEQR